MLAQAFNTEKEQKEKIESELNEWKSTLQVIHQIMVQDSESQEKIMRDADETIAKLYKEIDDKDKEIETLKKTLEQYKQNAEADNHLIQYVEFLEKEKQQMLKEKSELLKKVNEQTIKIAKLESELQKVITQNSNYADELKEFRIRLDERYNRSEQQQYS